ncbi:MAG: LytTR family transcriptional regulator DNA-binding domain-containing protein [Microscillaceae bacterium]|jgi:DNA-binding LytR/AlgR family response regulator|nr:LytTR family transcriptional regulator DNA-binding domain-containing protein [Microscillaceae bacterium]
MLNNQYISELEPYFNGEYIPKRQGGQKLKVSSSYRQNILAILNG